MYKFLLKFCLLWGFILWLIGYALGIVLFPFVPNAWLGWVIMPFGIAITVWVLLKKVAVTNCKERLILATTWTLIAVLCDYFLLVKLFKPADGYYKLDVYLYYALTFTLPFIIKHFQHQTQTQTKSPTT